MKDFRPRRFRPAALPRVLALLALGFVALASSAGALEPVSLEPPPWPEWVLRHWVWENSGTQESALQLVDDYLARDIPVGALIVDRPWMTHSTTFVPDPLLYPDMAKLVADCRERGVRFFLWITSVVNKESPNFAEGKEKGYFLSDGRLVKWWAGEGAMLDYTNPEAVEWWHRMMDPILDMGIDGWKIDGTDPFLILLGGAKGKAGRITRDEYRDLFYRDFFDYTRERLGPDRVISARPCDGFGQLPKKFPFAPPDVNFAGWVGDQDSDFAGLRSALDNFKASSELGYVNFGSDTGGFRGPAMRETDLFVRWTQLSAFCPIFENGGGGEHRPWMYPDPVLPIYRRYVFVHHELIPYLYSQGAESWAKKIPLMRFVGEGYDYMLGDDIFVAPIVEAGERYEIALPPGTWREWTNDDRVHTGGATIAMEPGLENYPAFVRQGAILPLDVVGDASGRGDDASKGALTLCIYPEPGGSDTFDLYEEKGTGSRFAWRSWGEGLVVEATPTKRPLLIRVKADRVFREAATGTGAAIEADVHEEQGLTIVRIADASAGVEVRLLP